ncbi:hypothetical protein GCM10028796_52060 [Ramlibacter monticola]
MPGRAPVRQQFACGLLVAAGVTGAAGAAAQSRTIYSLSVPTEIEHDSNPNLAVGPSAGTTWFRTIPSLTAGYVLGNEVFSLEAALTAEKSSNQEVARDRLDPRVRAAWKHVDSRNTTELAALLDRRALRALDVREQVPLGVDGSRTLFALSGSWLHDLDARTVVGADVRQVWERFSDTTTPDFRHTTGAVRLTREQDDRQSWYAALTGQAYDPESDPDPLDNAAAPKRSHAFGVLVGVTRSLSDTWRVDANAGPVHFTSPSSRDDWQGALKLEYRGERWVSGLELARAPGVNSTFGGLVVTEEARLRLRYELDALSRLELDAGHAREKETRTNRSAASVAWVRQWSASWQVAVRAATHRHEGPEGTARSNRIAVSLVYTAPDL